MERNFYYEEGYTSSIDYCYSEEEKYVSENEETCDGDHASSQNHKTEPLNDISADVSEQKIPNSKKDDKYDPELSLAVYDVGAEEVDAFKLSKPPNKNEWMKTWPKESKKALVNVYGYHNQHKGFGGYAVIVRTMSKEPIAVSVMYVKYGRSFLHQVMWGIAAGLKLASEHGCSGPNVLCNSRLVVKLLSKAASGVCCCESKTVSTICEKCTSKIAPHLSSPYIEKLVPLIEKLQGLRGSSTIEWDSGKNEAAHFLAKSVKMDAMYERMDFARATVEKPEGYPDELVDILLKDAFDTGSYNLDERTGIEVSKAPTGKKYRKAVKDSNTVEASDSTGIGGWIQETGKKKGKSLEASEDSSLSTGTEEKGKKGKKKGKKKEKSLEASEDSSLSTGTEGWIQEKGKKKGKSLEASEDSSLSTGN